MQLVSQSHLVNTDVILEPLSRDFESFLSLISGNFGCISYEYIMIAYMRLGKGSKKLQTLYNACGTLFNWLQGYPTS